MSDPRHRHGEEAALEDRPLDPQVKLLGDQLIEDLRAENIGVGIAEIRGYYCLKLNLSDDLDEYLRLTTLEVEEEHYLLLSTSPGGLTLPKKAMQLLSYGTQFAKVELSGDGELALRWILPMSNITGPLLKEVALSMVYDTFMIRTTILGN